VVGAVCDHDQHVNEFDDSRYIDHLDIDQHHIDDESNDAVNSRRAARRGSMLVLPPRRQGGRT
jgi:hypothetical protein